MKYRRNVGVIFSRDGLVLVGRRRDVADCWQFPQGGVDGSETEEEAIVREIFEETGLRREEFSLGVSRSGYSYDFPPEMQKRRGQKGQKQRYFFAILNVGAEPKVSEEFAEWRWVNPQEFSLEWVPEFKRGVYRQIFQDFLNLSFK